LEVEDPGSPEGIEYVAGEFVLYEIVFEDGKPVEKNPVNVSNQVTLSSDKRSFTYSMGNLDGKAYMLHYRSTYRQGLKLKNTAELTSTETGKIVQSQFQDAESGGGGQGNLTSKIKIVKVTEDNEEIKLKNAKFKITRKATGATFEVITDSNGEAVTMQLIPGEYEIEEIAAPDHYLVDNTKYTVVVTSDNVAIKTITNEPEKIDIKVQKKWIGPVGSEVTVVLKADGVEIANHKLSAPDWEYTFTNLRKYDAQTGEKIKYIAEEKDVLQGYTPSISGSIGDGFIITNTNNEKVDIPVEKKWVGPAGDSVVVQVKAEGSNDVVAEYELKASEEWKHTFTGLDKYAADGTLVKYKVVEKNVPQGYEVTYDKDSSGKWVITNTNVEKTEVSVEKKWVGAEKDSVLVELKAEGSNSIIKEYEIKKSEGWKHTFTGLDKYAADGTLIKYKVVEKNVPQGYTVSYETDPTGILVIKNTQDKTEVKVTKAWEDKNDQDGKRPASVTIKLLADGEEVSGKTLTLTEANNWTGTFTDLVKYKAGKKIEYTIKEEPVGNGYVSVITGSAEDGYKVTNTREPEKVKVEGKKTWNDKDNQDGKRPAEITINLLKNGAVVETKTITEADGWKWKFEGLDKYENGNVITYSITEERVEGYSAEINGYDVKNSYTPGKTSVQVTKAWEDKNDQDGVRPNSVTIKLLADGKETGKTLTLTKADNWTGTFTDLDEYKAGKKIKYTIKEESVGNGYVSAITGSAEDGYVVTNVRTPNTPPEKPNKPNLPKTGDGSNMSLYALLMLTSGTLLLLVGYRRRKQAK
ncbi:MAG: Cna B-type domain-containing protein, partial [Hornefia sp.]|nr:Cna B-type domain-containing protein [Hornefia sp.]